MPLNTISLDFIDEPNGVDRGRMVGAIRATLACVVTHHRRRFDERTPSRRSMAMAGIVANNIARNEQKRFPALD